MVESLVLALTFSYYLGGESATEFLQCAEQGTLHIKSGSSFTYTLRAGDFSKTSINR